jgi:hypothetical protein
MQGCRGQHCVLELSCSPARGRCTRAGTARVVPPTAAGRLGWLRTSSARLRRRGGTPRRDRCCLAVQGRELAYKLEDVSVTGKPVKQDAAGDRGVLRSGPLPGRHTPTVGQNH